MSNLYLGLNILLLLIRLFFFKRVLANELALYVPSIGVNRNGGVNRNTHQKSSSDLNFSKLKSPKNSFVHKLFIWFLSLEKLRSEKLFWGGVPIHPDLRYLISQKLLQCHQIKVILCLCLCRWFRRSCTLSRLRTCKHEWRKNMHEMQTQDKHCLYVMSLESIWQNEAHAFKFVILWRVHWKIEKFQSL